MTDKQIKETKNGFYCIEPCCEIKELKEKLLSKEQECEELKKQCELEKEMCTSWCNESYKDKEENIKLKEEIDNLKQYKSSKQASYEALQKKCNELELKNRKLKAENEGLKKQVCGLRPELKYIIDKTCCKYNINAKYYHEKIVEIIINLDKYKQTLTEIKEIAEDFYKTGFVRTDCGATLINNNICIKILEQILQKISEVEDGN